MSEFPLDTFQTATVDAGGIATTLGIGPVKYGETWEVKRYSISLTTGTGKCTVYRNEVKPTRQIDYTTAGDGDTSENESIRLQVGDKIIVQWTEADPGAIGTITFAGTVNFKGR